MLTLTILHELEVDDLLDESGMYLGEGSVFSVSVFCPYLELCRMLYISTGRCVRLMFVTTCRVLSLDVLEYLGLLAQL